VIYSHITSQVTAAKILLPTEISIKKSTYLKRMLVYMKWIKKSLFRGRDNLINQFSGDPRTFPRGCWKNRSGGRPGLFDPNKDKTYSCATAPDLTLQ